MAGRGYHNQPNYHDTRPPRESTSRDRNDNREAIARRDSNSKPHWKSAPTAESHESKTPLSTSGGRRVSRLENQKSRCENQGFMELIGEMAHVRTQLISTEDRYNKIKHELQASGTKPVEFSSVEKLKRNQLVIHEKRKIHLDTKLARIYVKLQAQIDSVFKQPPSTDLPSIDPPSAPAQNTVSQKDFEPRLAKLHESITKWTEIHVQGEIKALRQSVLEQREPNNTEMQALRDSLDKERQKSQALQNQIEEGQRKSQSLEERLGQLERMYQTIKPTELQISSEVNKTVTAKVSSLEEKLNQPITSNAETFRQLQSFEKQQSARLQIVAPVVPNIEAEVCRLQETIQKHESTVETYGHNMDFLKRQTIADLEKAMTRSSTDIQDVRALVAKQSSTIEDQGKRQRYLQEIVSSLQKAARDLAGKHNVLDSTVNRLCSEQADGHRVLDTAVARLSSSTENCTKEQETLSSNMTSLKSSVKDKLQALDTQASELASLQVSVKHQQEMTDDLGKRLVSISASAEETPKLSSLQLSIKKQQKKSHELEATLASLERKIAEQPLQDFKKLAGKVQEYPSATDLKRLLVDYPSGKELKILITDIPRLKESISNLKARQTPPPPAPAPDSSMNRETMMQTLKPSFSQMEIRIKGEMDEKMKDLFEKLLVFVKNQVADLDSKFEDELGKSNRQTKMVKELCDNLTTRNTEQTTKFDEAISVLGENVDKVRNEAKACTDDLQYQITWLHDGLKNLSSKQWYDNVAKQIMSYMPTHFNVQLNGLVTRVSCLEDRANDSESGNKRRRAANGSPLVTSGAR